MPQSHIPLLYRQPFGLLLDLYHLTMAYGFWRRGLHGRKAVFNLFFRKAPFGNPFAIVAGLAPAIDILENFRFAPDDIRYLGGLNGADGKPLFDASFLNYLGRLSFECDVDAMPEGSVALADEPLVRVQGPLIQAQMVESALLNMISFSTLIATKAARLTALAGDDPVVDFGLRRAQGIDGALTAARSAYIGGCHGTSNVLAGRFYGIPVRGTHAHSWVMVFGDELTAFREYAAALPNNCIFLVDTYDTIQGVRHAIEIGRQLREQGHEMGGIRLDSGDLISLSTEARRLLDEAGFHRAVILASDQIDEKRLVEMKAAGARINGWGIGTHLVTAYDQPALGGVYKLAAVTDEKGEWTYRMKLSEEKIKVSNPGIQQVRRFFDATGAPAGDLIYDLRLPFSGIMADREKRVLRDFNGWSGQDLLVPVFRAGRRVYESPGIHEIRNYSLQQQQLFRGVNGKEYRPGLEKNLSEKKQQLHALHL